MTTARIAKISGTGTPSRTVNPARRFLQEKSKGIGSAGSGNSSNASFSPPSEIDTRLSVTPLNTNRLLMDVWIGRALLGLAILSPLAMEADAGGSFVTMSTSSSSFARTANLLLPKDGCKS